MYSRREFIEIVQLLAARGLLHQVLPGLALMQSGELTAKTPPTNNSNQAQLLRNASQTLTDYLQLTLDQFDTAIAALARQPAVVSFGLQADYNSGHTANSYTVGGVVSADFEHLHFAAGLFVNTTTAESLTTNPLPGVALGASASIGTGQLIGGFYGNSRVASTGAVLGTGEGATGSLVQNDEYTGVGASLLVVPGLPSFSTSISAEPASNTIGESTVVQIDLSSWISDAQTALWDASQDPMDPIQAPP